MTAQVPRPLFPTPDRDLIFSVDDEEDDRRLFERRLREAGVPCTCRTFRHGGELLEALLDVLRGAPAPLACFVDVKMAGMGGLDVLRWIRAQRGLDEIPVIMLSSSDTPAHLSEANQFGAQCYTVKFPTPELMARILAEAREYGASARCHSPFALPCNLLVGAHAAL